MAGPVSDIVLVPRFTTLHGSGTFVGLPVDVSGYDEMALHVWRGKIAGTFEIAFQASLDRTTWAEVAGGDPGEDSEALYSADLHAPWLRAVVTLAKTQPSDPDDPEPTVTCWAYGIVVARAR